MDCRWHAIKKSVWRNSRRRHDCSSRGHDKNASRYGNSFAPFLNHIECYNCGNFGHEVAHCIYNKINITSHHMHANVASQDLKARIKNGVEE